MHSKSNGQIRLQEIVPRKHRTPRKVLWPREMLSSVANSVRENSFHADVIFGVYLWERDLLLCDFMAIQGDARMLKSSLFCASTEARKCVGYRASGFQFQSSWNIHVHINWICFHSDFCPLLLVMPSPSGLSYCLCCARLRVVDAMSLPGDLGTF